MKKIDNKRMFLKVSVFISFGLTLSLHSYAKTEITNIEFKGTADPSLIEIRGNGPLTAEKQTLSEDRQIILEFKNTSLPKAQARKIDTSAFNGPITLISPYQVEGQEDTVRIIIQLRDPIELDMKSEGNSIILSTTGAPLADASMPTGATEAPNTDPMNQPIATDNALTKDSPVSTDKDKISQFLDAKETRVFTGKPISIHLKDTDIHDAFRLIADASGFNLLVSEDVKGKVTLSLTNVPWDQALDILLKGHGLGAEKNFNILRITTLGNLIKEREVEMQALLAARNTRPKVTKVFPINYVPLEQMCGTIVTILGAGNCSGAKAGAEGNSVANAFSPETTPRLPANENEQGRISRTQNAGMSPIEPTMVMADAHTNSLIIRETAENIQKIKNLIDILDTQSPQVLVEAKIVEAEESYANNLKGTLSLNRFNNRYPLPSLATGGLGPSDLISLPASSEGALGLSSSLSFLPGIKLNALLTLGESDNKLKVIASPRSVVLNGQKAVLQEEAAVIGAPNVTITEGVAVKSTNIIKGKIGLAVKPTITNDGGVNLDLNIQRDTPKFIGKDVEGTDVTDFNRRNLNTVVLVENGNTLVIGGLFIGSSAEASGGVPFLRKIPILGLLFGNKVSNESRSELFIFITPKILNTKESGLSS